MYNYGPASNQATYTACNGQVIQNDGNDAPLSTIVNHIAQLAPTLNQYNDVIYEIDAGFIGQWGEWHSSTHGNDTLTAHNQVITNERNHFPSNRHITLRRPAYKGNYLRGLGYGLTPGLLPQLGYHNWKFDDNSDMFYDPQNILSWNQDYTFYSNDVSFTANGADEFDVTSFDANTALNRMQQYHYTIMAVTPNLLSYWQTTNPGVLATMQRRLGYRVQVTQATTPNMVSRGYAYTVSVNLVNNGFAKLMNTRGMYAVFVNGNSTYLAGPLRDSNGNSDLTGLTLAAGIKTYTANFTLPNTFPIGTAQTTLWLPDNAANLHNNPLFSMHLDGTNVNWDATAGRNILALNNIQVQ